MLFDDLFYPDNPKRRQEVALLQGEIKSQFIMFKNSWNGAANLMNPIFAEQPDPRWRIKIRTLNYDITKNDIKQCVGEINGVVKDTKQKLNCFIDDIGLSPHLPADWEKADLHYDPEGFNVGSFLGGVVSTAAAAFVTYYVYQGVRTFVTLINMAGAMISNLTSVLGGAFAGVVLGAAAFVITDMIASAITGAIERRELNEAIDSLRQLKEQVSDKLMDSISEIGGVSYAIKKGMYRLDDGYILLKGLDGKYYIVPDPSDHVHATLELVKTG